jgi:hypothetical protein
MADRAQGILLASTAVIAHLPGPIDLLALTTPPVLPLVALGELYKARKNRRGPPRTGSVWTTSCKSLRCFIPTALRQRFTLQPPWIWNSKARPSPRNDIWIAAVALQCDKPLATRDARFQRVEGLTVIEW